MSKLTFLKAGVVVFATSFIAPNSFAENYRFVAGDNSVETKLCVSAVSNNVAATKRYIKSIGVKGMSRNNQTKLAIHSVRCNNTDLVEFTANYDAKDTFKFLNRSAPAKYKIGDQDVRIIDIAKQTNSKNVTIVVVTSR